VHKGKSGDDRRHRLLDIKGVFMAERSERSPLAEPLFLSPTFSPPEIPILDLATVLVTSEDPGYPVINIFDEHHGPGGTQWIAGAPGEQTIIIAFHQAVTIRRIVLEVEEREISRTQELALCVSRTGGETFRELRRQEFNFNPETTTWEREEWRLEERYVTHLKLIIRADKGRTDVRAKLTSFIVAAG
jgi:hypothetical protein